MVAKRIISLCIPLHNPSDGVLKKQFDKVEEFCKKNPDTEVLISDDKSSTDYNLNAFIEVISGLATVRTWHHNSNLGVYQNHFFLAKKARGKYVTFLSQDDEKLPRFIKFAITTLNRNKDIVCVYPLLLAKDTASGNVIRVESNYLATTSKNTAERIFACYRTKETSIWHGVFRRQSILLAINVPNICGTDFLIQMKLAELGILVQYPEVGEIYSESPRKYDDNRHIRKVRSYWYPAETILFLYKTVILYQSVEVHALKQKWLMGILLELVSSIRTDLYSSLRELRKAITS